jgi:hypothetical protein
MFRIKLGPRMIPYFRETVTECVSVIREGGTSKGASAVSVTWELIL